MERKYEQYLLEWKNKKNRKPLLVFGARQVGKTFLIKKFGENNYDNIINVNFETNTIIGNIIKEDIEPKNIIKELEIVFNEKIVKGKTLIFFDEIQANPRALTSLKYFYENEPEYHIVAAGSLLGVHINKENYSFPVGKVDILTIYPMDFEEFLIATNNQNLVLEIKKCFKNNNKTSLVIHKKALDLFNDYLSIGGMPEVVSEYSKNNSLIECIDIQSKILASYKSDITKYADKTEANKILATFDSIPNQLAKDNKKFQYKLVQKGGTNNIFGNAIDWLINSGIANKCYKSNVGIPIKMYEQLDSFKLYMNDVGLLTNLSQFPIYLIKNRGASNELMIGMLIENYVSSCLKFNDLNINYWQNDFNSEVDFILQTEKGYIIPVEVKSNINTKSRSLTNYINNFKPKYSIRISSKNFGFVNNIKSIPLYAVFCINKKSLDEYNK